MKPNIHKYMRRPISGNALFICSVLKALREQDIRTPFIIYASSDRPEHEALAKSRGAFGSTGNPRKLFQLVIDAIQHGPLPTQM